ncbi:MAG TPA: hypothetical protein VGD91_25865, partial [Trebonia sp.]
MATGPEHYREAERMYLMSWENDREPENVTQLLACAQVHATLALAAATALASTGIGEADLGEWTALICEPDGPNADEPELMPWEQELLDNAAEPYLAVFTVGDVVNVVDGTGAVIVGVAPEPPFEGLRGSVVAVS